jgi:signal transduction histidine kinase
VRERALEKLRRPSAAWKFLWYLPFDACAISALIRDHAHARLALQIATFALCCGGLAIAHRRERRHAPFMLGLAASHYFVGVANTGGLASPLVIAGLPMVAIAGIMLEHRRQRMGFALAAIGMFLLFATSRSSSLVYSPTLLFDSGTTTAHCIFAAATGVVAVLALLHLGTGITRAYTEVVYDLAARQEEICEDGEDMGRSLQGMAARVAHEVKNPLASIKALSTLEAKRATDPQTAERLGVIATEADRLRDVVDGFLSFSKQASSLRLADVKPYDVAREITILLEGRTVETGVGVEVLGDEVLTIIADGRKLRQALLNLVLNAVQASPNGSTVRLAVDRMCDAARIRVIDRGEGMTSDVLERVRRPHYSTRSGGSGLGLAVARSIIEQHGGELELSSKKGSGTTATITLPLKPRESVVASMQWLASS